MLRAILSLACISVIMCGCSTTSDIVTTEISLNKADGTLHIASPKDIKITGMTYERTEQGVKVVIQEYASQGNAEALKAVQMEHQAISDTANALSNLVKK